MQMQGYMTRLGRWRALSERTRARDEVSLGLAVYMWTCGLTSLGLVCVFWPSPYLLTALLALDGALMLRARRSGDIVVGSGDTRRSRPVANRGALPTGRSRSQCRHRARLPRAPA